MYDVTSIPSSLIHLILQLTNTEPLHLQKSNCKIRHLVTMRYRISSCSCVLIKAAFHVANPYWHFILATVFLILQNKTWHMVATFYMTNISITRKKKAWKTSNVTTELDQTSFACVSIVTVEKWEKICISQPLPVFTRVWSRIFALVFCTVNLLISGTKSASFFSLENSRWPPACIAICREQCSVL